MTTHDAITRGRARAARLVAAAAPSFPRDIQTTRRHDDWAVTAPAFVARSTRLMQALVTLPDEHESAAGVLLRVLFEHVALFAWLAIDPPAHLPRWVRQDREWRIKADNDMAAAFNENLLTPAQKVAFEAEVAAIPQKLPSVPDMAAQADVHWGARMKEFTSSRYALRGMYVAIYRQYSPIIHGMVDSLHRIVLGGPQAGVSRVGLEDEHTDFNAFTSAPFVYALGLLVSGEVNGFPTRQSVIDACV
jgi:hypothetical protein